MMRSRIASVIDSPWIFYAGRRAGIASRKKSQTFECFARMISKRSLDPALIKDMGIHSARPDKSVFEALGLTFETPTFDLNTMKFRTRPGYAYYKRIGDFGQSRDVVVHQ